MKPLPLTGVFYKSWPARRLTTGFARVTPPKPVTHRRFTLSRIPSRLGIFGLNLWLTLAAGLAARAEIPGGWSTNFAATLAAAESARQPVLAYFTASWCGPCKLMSRLTLTDPAAGEALAQVGHVAVDIDEQPALAKKYGISAVPAFLLLSAPDDEVERSTGFQAIGDFLPWLTNAIAGARQAVVQRARVRKTLADVDQLLASTETNALPRAAAKLFELCGARDATVLKEAADRLRIVAGREPLAVVDGLNDPRLAARIAAANALRDEMGEGFKVDPWSDAATRAKAVLSGRLKLSKPR